MSKTNSTSNSKILPAGTPEVNRRYLLTSLPAMAAAMSVPAVAVAAEPVREVTGCEKVHALAKELSQAMNGWNAELGIGWSARVAASDDTAHPIWYDNIDVVDDPLLSAIDAYLEGVSNYCASASRIETEEGDDALDAFAETTFQQHMRVLDAWEKPAQTRQSAIAALKLAQSEITKGDCVLAASMVAAALGWFQGRRAV